MAPEREGKRVTERDRCCSPHPQPLTEQWLHAPHTDTLQSAAPPMMCGAIVAAGVGITLRADVLGGGVGCSLSSGVGGDVGGRPPMKEMLLSATQAFSTHSSPGLQRPGGICTGVGVIGEREFDDGVGSGGGGPNEERGLTGQVRVLHTRWDCAGHAAMPRHPFLQCSTRCTPPPQLTLHTLHSPPRGQYAGHGCVRQF